MDDAKAAVLDEQVPQRPEARIQGTRPGLVSRLGGLGKMVVITCRLVTRSRATDEMLDLPMSQTARTRGDRISEFRPLPA